MTAIVLTYHSHNISGDTYATNDHVALASDLETIHRCGARIVPLRKIVALLRERSLEEYGDRVVGLSFDDGPVFDYEDFTHPDFGFQRGFAAILRDFRDRHGADAQLGLHATSFVIASPDARLAMERAPDCGYPFLDGWLSDAWWPEALRSGLIEIGNHSWDHVHHAPKAIAASAAVRDDFRLVDNYRDADAEIRQAAEYINGKVAGRCSLFAYPFGHVNDYLLNEYMPARMNEHGMIAAFGVGGTCVSPRESVWNIPRVVCGHHWRSPAELEALLR